MSGGTSRRSGSGNREPLLRETRSVLPLVLFPYEMTGPSHTRSMTGRGAVGGIKSSLSRVTVELTESAIAVRGRFTGKTHLRVPLGAIRSTEISERFRGALVVVFSDARWSLLARFATSGRPRGARDRIVLNVADPDRWLAAIRALRT